MDNTRGENEQPPKLPPEEWVSKEDHYRKLFETARDGIMVVDAETGNVIDVNPFLIDALGYPRQDFVNKPIWELGFLKQVFADKDKFEELKQKDYLPTINLPLETSTGAKLDAYLTGKSYEIEHRKLIQMHFQVLRERKEAESRLEESERRFHQLIEEAPIGIALSQQGKTIYVNSRFLKMFGFEKAEELVGTSFLDQVAPQSRVEVIERARQQEQGVTVNPDYDIQGLRKDGSQFPFQALIARVELENGPSLIGCFTDVTERKRAEAELRAAEDKFRVLAENTQDLIFRFRLGPLPGYEYVSPSALKIVGYTPEEYYNDPALGLKMIYPEDRVNVESAMVNPQVMPLTPIVMRCIRKDGQTIWLEQMNSVILDSHGAVVAIQGIARDITERKRVEKEIEHLASFPELNPNPVLEINLDGTINYANPATRKVFPDLVTLGTHHPYLAQWQNIVSKFGTEGPDQLIQEVDVEGRYYRQVFEYPGSLNVIRIYGNDITESKRAEQILLESEEKHRIILQTAMDGFWLTDIQGKLLEVNETYCRMSGYSEQELLAMRISDLESDETNPDIADRIKKIIANGEGRFETHHRRKDGTIIHVEVSVQYQTVNGGRFVVFIQDITERKNTQQELREREERYQQLLDDTIELIQSTAPDGKFLFVNKAWHDLLGYTEEDLEHVTLFDVIHPSSLEHCTNTFHEVLKGKSVSHVEAKFVSKDGRVLDVEGNAVPRRIGDKIIATHGFFRDVTAGKLKELENQQLRDKSEMSSRLAAVGEMAAGIAHEINNPLTGVIGFSELLLERTGLPDDIREELKIVNDGSTRVKEIVSRMLMFARQTKPHKSSVSIAELLDNTLELRSYVLKTSNIEVIREYDPNLPWVTADAGQLQQVFLNLIVNAEYAMKKANDKGILTIRTEALDDHICISISDNGPGISDKIKAKLFQPFFTTKEPGEGTGLGLSLSRGIIQEHFGTIRVESEVEKGTTFIIELPITPEEIEPVIPPPVAHVDQPIKRARILVVDDEPTVRALIKAILTQDGHRVEECDNSAQVLEKLKGTTFDILLVDLRMPGMNGMELYGEISTMWPKLAHRVIFVTGDTSDLNTREYLATHQIPFITKPFDRKTLEEKVNSVLRNT